MARRGAHACSAAVRWQLVLALALCALARRADGELPRPRARAAFASGGAAAVVERGGARRLSQTVSAVTAGLPPSAACGGAMHRWAAGGRAAALDASATTLLDVGASAAGGAPTPPSWTPGAWNGAWGDPVFGAVTNFTNNTNYVRARCAACRHASARAFLELPPANALTRRCPACPLPHPPPNRRCGAQVTAPGRVALDLTGGSLTSKYVSLLGGGNVTFGGPLSLAFWLAVKPGIALPSASGAPAALFHADDALFGTALSLQVVDAAGTLRAYFNDGRNATLATITAPGALLAGGNASAASWGHGALTADAAGVLRLYTNGTLAAASNASAGPVPLLPRDYAFMGLLLDGAGRPTSGVAPVLVSDVQLYGFDLAPPVVAALAGGRVAACPPYAEAGAAALRSACWNADARFLVSPASVTAANASMAALRNTGYAPGFFAPVNGSAWSASGAALTPFATFNALVLDGATVSAAFGAGVFGTGTGAAGAATGVTLAFRTFLSALPPAAGTAFDAGEQYLFSFGTPDASPNVRIGQRFYATVTPEGALTVLYDNSVRALFCGCRALRSLSPRLGFVRGARRLTRHPSPSPLARWWAPSGWPSRASS
jgi:hypothetical protein